MSKKRIGIYGGSFNPIHNGHIAVAKKVLELDLVDEVWFTVSVLNPFKMERQNDYASYEKRFKMVKTAIEGMDKMDVIRVEEALGSPSRTIKTLNALEALSDGAHEFHVIIGTDAWNQFDEFYEYELILYNYPIIVAGRTGCPLDKKSAVMKKLNEKDPENTIMVNFIDMDLPVAISSTDIRNDVNRGKGIYDRVPEGVAKYIFQNRIYQKPINELAKLLLEALESNGLTVSTAESCTGGGVGATITSIPGASNFFHGGIIAYNNDMKMKLLGVSEKTLKKYTEVSEFTAMEMAAGACEQLETNCAISVTGYASGHKDSGKIFVCATKKENGTFINKVENIDTRLDDRELNRDMSVRRGIDLLMELVSDADKK